MKRIIAITFLLAFLCPVMYAQDPVDPKKVPAKVVKTFQKKNAKATDLVWTKNGDVYTATYMLNELKMVNSYDRLGKWLEGMSWMEQKQLPPKVNDYLRDEFSGYKFREAFLFQDADREKHITVFMTDKVRGYDEPFVWEIWFTTLGQHISTFEPNIPDADVAADPPPDTKFQKKVDKNVDLLAEDTGDMKVNKRDLPTITLDYLKTNYDHEWIYKEMLIRETDDMGTVYYVIMKKQGYSETWEHYFDYNGELIRKTRLDEE